MRGVVHAPIEGATRAYHGTNHRLDPPRDCFAWPYRVIKPGDTFETAALEAMRMSASGAVEISQAEIARLRGLGFDFRVPGRQLHYLTSAHDPNARHPDKKPGAA